MIELVGVSKDYDGMPAVQDLTMTVPAGSVLGFLGPNGAGKTTTIKLLMGMLFPSAGSVRVDGIDPVAEPIKVRERVGYLPDVPFLYEYLSPHEMLGMVGALHRLDGELARRRAAALFEEFSLTDKATELILSLSKGTRKKVALALALLHEPPVLLLDEPTSGLDPQTVKVLKDRVRREQARGTTVVLSTHVLDVAQEVSTHLAIVHQGRLVFHDTLETAIGRATGEGRSLEGLFLQLTGTARHG
ncbi:MAG: ABC transporter ATP-binding protein [Candidatus Riflebacteria bacterium]|nr:ABC transporter ATP-binding protein [Candidatus Riflebacteria bacterium]